MNPLKSIPMTVGLGFILAILISLSIKSCWDPGNCTLWSLSNLAPRIFSELFG
jgi:hypothetical protein